MNDAPPRLPADSHEAIVLAGGFGTRLATVVSDVPKPMAPVAGRPFLEHVLDRIVAQGVRSVVLTVCHQRHVIMDHFADRYGGVPVRYSIERDPLGTGGSIAAALALVSCRAPLVLNGDSLFDVDLCDLAAFHRDASADITVALKPMRDFDRYGVVDVTDDGRIRAFHEKRPRRDGLINGGVYVVDRNVFGALDLHGSFSFEEHVLEGHTDRLALYGRAYDRYFIDIGVPADYARAQRELTK